MNFSTDSYFHIGNSHYMSGKPCQDYAVSGVYSDIAFAAVSDGCSTGGETDAGARIMCLCTATAVREYVDMHQKIRDEAYREIAVCRDIASHGVQSALGLDFSDLLATSLFACVGSKGGFVAVFGDGVIVKMSSCGNLFAHVFEWNDNMPFYPVYRNGDVKDFIKAHGGDVQSMCVREEVWKIPGSRDTCERIAGYEHSLSTGIRGIHVPITADVTCLALFTDGVCQIDNELWQDAVRRFMYFKNHNGVFAKRRMIRGIKDLQKKGKGPIDDIAYSVIHIDRSMEEES